MQDFLSGGHTVIFLAGETIATVSIPIFDDAIAELTEDFTAVLTIPRIVRSQGIAKGAAGLAFVNLVDNDAVEVVFSPTQYNVNESDGEVTLTLKADKAASFRYIVEVLTQDDTAEGKSFGVLHYSCTPTLHLLLF